MHNYVKCSRIPGEFLPSINLPRSWGIFDFCRCTVTEKGTSSCHRINYIYNTHIWVLTCIYFYILAYYMSLYYSHISTCMYLLTHIPLNKSAPSYLYVFFQGERFKCKILLFFTMFLSTFGTILLLLLWVLFSCVCRRICCVFKRKCQMWWHIPVIPFNWVAEAGGCQILRLALVAYSQDPISNTNTNTNTKPSSVMCKAIDSISKIRERNKQAHEHQQTNQQNLLHCCVGSSLYIWVKNRIILSFLWLCSLLFLHIYNCLVMTCRAVSAKLVF